MKQAIADALYSGLTKFERLFLSYPHWFQLTVFGVHARLGPVLTGLEYREQVGCITLYSSHPWQVLNRVRRWLLPSTEDIRQRLESREYITMSAQDFLDNYGS